MILATVLVMFTIVMFVCFQAACRKILRREFDREYSQPVINATRLEFRALRQSLGGDGASVDYRRVARMLKCDFFTLCYLLRNRASTNQKHTNQERLLILYFRWQLLSLTTRHWLGVGEKQAALRLTTVLQYFANLVGQRASLFYTAQFGSARPGSGRPAQGEALRRGEAGLWPAMLDSLCNNGCPFGSRAERRGAVMNWERGLPARTAGRRP